jgi:hypothetical protein
VSWLKHKMLRVLHRSTEADIKSICPIYFILFGTHTKQNFWHLNESTRVSPLLRLLWTSYETNHWFGWLSKILFLGSQPPYAGVSISIRIWIPQILLIIGESCFHLTNTTLILCPHSFGLFYLVVCMGNFVRL